MWFICVVNGPHLIAKTHQSWDPTIGENITQLIEQADMSFESAKVLVSNLKITVIFALFFKCSQRIISIT